MWLRSRARPSTWAAGTSRSSVPRTRSNPELSSFEESSKALGTRFRSGAWVTTFTGSGASGKHIHSPERRDAPVVARAGHRETRGRRFREHGGVGGHRGGRSGPAPDAV